MKTATLQFLACAALSGSLVLPTLSFAKDSSVSQSHKLFATVEKMSETKNLPGSDCGVGKCGTQMTNITFGLNQKETAFGKVWFTSLYGEMTEVSDPALVASLVNLLKDVGYKFSISTDRADDGSKLFTAPTLPAINCSSDRDQLGQDNFNCDITQRLGIGN